MATKISKSILRKAAREAKNNGSIDKKKLRSNKKTTSDTLTNAKRQIKRDKKKSGGIKWNLDTGDLVWINSSEQPQLGYIINVDTVNAENLQDWRQSASVMTNNGLKVTHPKYLKIIQKSS